MSNHTLKPLANRVLAYTDGACRGNPGKGGYGAVVIFPSGEQLDICGGETNTTNNRMELMGAIAALEHSPSELPIQIWSDSNYVIKGISEWLAGWKKKNWKNVKNIELWQRLDSLCQHRQIDWQWVKGHAGHSGNEYADQLANQGIDQLPKTFSKLSKTAQLKPTPSLENLNVTAVTDSCNNLTAPSVAAKKKDSMMTPNFNQPSPLEIEANLPVDMTTNDTASEDIFLQLLDDDIAPTNNTQVANTPPQATQHNQPVTQPATAAVSQHFSQFVDEQGYFIAQDERLIAMRPEFTGVTSQSNPTFVPLLPHAKHKGLPNRQLILDTETTRFEAQNGDRIIEVGIVEMVNRRFTGEKLHVYINPLREMGEDVIRVHGIHNVFLDDMPVFEQVGRLIFEFLEGAELIAHNANFDMNFLQAEFARLGLPDILASVNVIDSLAIAKQLYAGQRNTLDALVKRLNVGKQDRTFHGALLDAEILAEVYLAMTGGQVALAIDDEVGRGLGGSIEHQHFALTVKRFLATTESEQAHQGWLDAFRDKNPQLVEHWQGV